jgi:hypothetical protein
MPIGLVYFCRRHIIVCLLHMIVLLQVVVAGTSPIQGPIGRRRAWQNGSRAATMYGVLVSERGGHE